MSRIIEYYESFIHRICSKIFRVFIMFILTITSAVVEIVYGIRLHSNSLIADGLYSFAEGVCLIGVMLVLRYSHNIGHRQKYNTFGHERLELLFGLIQEVFLLSISLGIIVDAVNHIINPIHVHDPQLMIILGGSGALVGLFGMIIFWGYHHDHNIEEEINEKKKKASLKWTKNIKLNRKSPAESRHNTFVEAPLITEQNQNTFLEAPSITEQNQNTFLEVPLLTEQSQNTFLEAPLSTEQNQNTFLEVPLLTEQSQNETNDQLDKNINMKIKEEPASLLEAFTYENVEIAEPRIYATLHALCLHSFVVLLESVIVASSGLMIKFIPHVDPITNKEINVWLKYIDPLLTLIMVVVITVRAVPAIASISKILIDSVPGRIDTQELMKDITTAIPAIKSVHSLHIWRAAAQEVYATLHLVCNEDVLLSTCTNRYGEDIQNILKSYCIRYFTLQFEHIPVNQADQSNSYRCVYGLHRKRRGHTLAEPRFKLNNDAVVNIQ